MSDISTYINPANGDYLIQNGTILNNNSLLAEMYFCVNTPLGSYIYDKTFGNQLLNLPYAPEGTTIQQCLTNSLSSLVSSGRIKNLQIRIIISTKNAYSVLINAIDSTGQPVQLKWQKID